MKKPNYSKKLQDYLKNRVRYNILFPSERITGISDAYQLVPEIVILSPDLSDGDVWDMGTQTIDKGSSEHTFGITKRGLERIARAAGVSFIPEYCKRTDDQRNPRRVQWQSTACVQRPDGSWITVTQAKEIDLDVVEAEVMAGLVLDAQQGRLKLTSGTGDRVLVYGTPECTKEIASQGKATMLIWKKNMLSFAITGATNRVVRSLLLLKDSYTLAELAKPFVVPRVSLNTARLLKNGNIAELLLRNGLAVTNQLYGSGNVAGTQLRTDPSQTEPSGSLSVKGDRAMAREVNGSDPSVSSEEGGV